MRLESKETKDSLFSSPIISLTEPIDVVEQGNCFTYKKLNEEGNCKL